MEAAEVDTLTLAKRRMNHHVAKIVALILISSVFHANTVQANPTSKTPENALAAHGTIEGAKELVASLYKIYQTEEQFVLKCFERKDRPDTYSERQISKSAGTLWKARRDAEKLKLMGEPAGYDLAIKLRLLAAQISGFGRAYGRTPKAQRSMQRIRSKVQKNRQRLATLMKQADTALGQGKAELVEKQLESKGIELNGDLVFFSPSERQKLEPPFSMSKCDEVNGRLRKQQYFDQAREVVAKQVAMATSFPDEAKRIAGEIASGGSTTLGKGQKGGPVEAFAYVAKLWGNASAALTRATTIQWTFTRNTESQPQPSLKQLQELAIPALASIIDAAANTATPENARTLYTQILQQISVVDRRSRLEAVSKGCEAALAKLAARDPQLANQIKSYDLATAQVLDWRESYARQQSINLEKQFKDSITFLETVTEVEESKRPPFAKPPLKTLVAPKTFGEPANWMAYESGARLVGKPVKEKGMLRLTPTSRTAVIPYGGRHYANVPVPMPSEQAVADLKAALLVDESYGPLSIKAADAVSSADLHDYMTVGGVVQTVHLEGAVTRFIGLPDVAYPLTPLGTTPSFRTDTNLAEQTCWRLDMMPIWARNRYFTVIMPKK